MIRNAVKEVKILKAVCSDDLSEIIKLIDKDNLSFLEVIFNRIMMMVDIRRSGSNLLLFSFLTKKIRLINFMSHALKIFVKVLHKRIHRSMNPILQTLHYDVRGMGTREAALFSVCLLLQT